MTETTAVVVCAHATDRLDLTVKCVGTVLKGTQAPDEVYVVVDNNEELAELLGQQLEPGKVQLLANEGVGASDARTTAIRRTTCDLVLFLDDDAWPEPNWLEEMKAAFSSPEVVGAGGMILPDWEPGATELPGELLWIVGSTYKGHPEGRIPITRPLGASMAARRGALESVGGFPHEFGPRGGKKSSSNEELALFSRLREVFGDQSILHVPSAVVHHFAPARRTTWHYLVERSWAEGTSKADIRRAFGRLSMGHDSGYVKKTLLPAIASYCRVGIADKDRQAVRDAAMCTLALTVTAAGYGARRLESTLTR